MTTPRRYGSVIGLKPEHAAEYARLHADAWPGVLSKITECGIRNYSIYRHENLLFSYFEYVGRDFEADMARMAEDPTTQEWWAVCKPMQEPVPNTGPGGWWTDLDELFHLD